VEKRQICWKKSPSRKIADLKRLWVAATRSAQKMADGNPSKQSEPVLLDEVLAMPPLGRPVLSESPHASQISLNSRRAP
jgi:hypothetical protein